MSNVQSSSLHITFLQEKTDYWKKSSCVFWGVKRIIDQKSYGHPQKGEE